MLDHERRRRGERSWKLIEPTGISLRVSLSVSEGGDQALIHVRIDSNVIASDVPPWIARRRAAVRVDSQVDADQRELFIDSSSTRSPRRSPNNAPAVTPSYLELLLASG